MSEHVEPNTIAILDDEPDRISAMRRLLQEHVPDLVLATFANGPAAIEWLKEHVASCVLICLDHDLGPDQERGGVRFDPGTGRDVVDQLTQQTPTCPVIVHTTNIDARPGMLSALRQAGWTTTYVTPYDDTLWIEEVWITEVMLALGGRL